MAKIPGVHLPVKAIAWLTSTSYNVGDIVTFSGYDMQCIVAHTSGTLANDIQSLYWNMATPADNFLINGNFDFWQRGTSYTFGANNAYGAADRWNIAYNGAGSPAWAQSASVPNSNSRFSYQFTSAAANNCIAYQKIESTFATPLAGKYINVGGWFKSVNGTSGVTVSLNVNIPTAQDNYTSTTAVTVLGNSTQTLSSNTGTWQYFTWQVLLPTTAENGIQIYFVSSNLSASAQTFSLAQVMVNLGPAPSPIFYVAGKNNASDFMMCQRYFSLSASGSIGIADNSSTVLAISYKHPVPMRAIPSLSVLSGSTVTYRNAAVNYTASSPALQNQNQNSTNGVVGGGWVQITGFSGLTSGITYQDLDSSNWLACSAEL